MLVRKNIPGWEDACSKVEDPWVQRILANIEPIAQIDSVVYIKYTGKEDKKEFVKAALSPAKVESVEILDDDETARVIVEKSQLSLAIGKAGQNARLAAKLTGMRVDIKTLEDVLAAKEEKLAKELSQEESKIEEIVEGENE